MGCLLDGEPDELKIECLVKLLITVGSGLEVNKKAEMDEWFKVLDRVQKQRVARIRFVIQNLQQVRASGWRNNEREGGVLLMGFPSAHFVCPAKKLLAMNIACCTVPFPASTPLDRCPFRLLLLIPLPCLCCTQA